MDSLGKRIKHYRKAAGLTQGQLAKACGWGSQSRVGNYELDTREPSFADLKAIADAVGVDITALLKQSSPQPNDDATAARTSPRDYPVINADEVEQFVVRESSPMVTWHRTPEDHRARDELVGLIGKLSLRDVQDLLAIARKMFSQAVDPDVLRSGDR